MVGIDVVVTAPNPVIGSVGNKTFLVGPPRLAVEILSPTDEYDDICERVANYLDAGVPMVLVVDPYFQTIRVHRLGMAPVMFNNEQDLSGEDVLPGFRVAVADVFAE